MLNVVKVIEVMAAAEMVEVVEVKVLEMEVVMVGVDILQNLHTNIV